MSPTTSAPHSSLNLWTESTFLTRFLSQLPARPAQTSPTLALTPPSATPQGLKPAKLMMPNLSH